MDAPSPLAQPDEETTARGACLTDATAPQMHIATRHELLSLALKNAKRSVPLLVVAGCFEGWIGWAAGARGMALFVGIVTFVLGGWRLWLGQRSVERTAPRQIDRIELELAGNSLLAGVLWASASIGIYPLLDPRAAGVHIMMLLGSAAVAAHFMTLVRWSYALLAIPSIGSLALVSMFDRSVQSYALGVLSVGYMATLLLAGRAYRATATKAIEHALVADAAIESLKKARDDAEAGAVAKSQFLATMSHEIRTPMNGVLGSLELLRRSGLNQEQQRLARIAASSGGTLMAILNDVLDHSKIEAGKLALDVAPLSVQGLMASVVGLFRSNAEVRGLSLQLHVDETAPDWVLGDGQRLKQVLLNLVSNAIKFTEHGGIELSVKALPSRPGIAKLQFAVRDSGIGLAAESLQRLFSPFTQFEQAGHRTRRGTGLGLAISQRIVDAMGSAIEVESVPGEGSRFHFTLELPRHHAEPPTAAPETVAGALDASSLGAATVLVAEDEPVNRLIARSMLESLGLTVIEAADGQEALAKARMHAVDLVLMDCQMPNLDGYAAARRWRERERRLGHPRTPILALTANAFEEDVQKSRDAGMDGHLSKPYTRKELRAHVQQWLAHDELST
jgi:signal transduction histidine kinase/ActR/RegA family two-component response regulator